MQKGMQTTSTAREKKCKALTLFCTGSTDRLLSLEAEGAARDGCPAIRAGKAVRVPCFVQSIQNRPAGDLPSEKERGEVHLLRESEDTVKDKRGKMIYLLTATATNARHWQLRFLREKLNLVDKKKKHFN